MFNFIKFEKNSDKWLKYATYFLMGFGFLMIISATMGIDADSIEALIYAITKQLIFTILGYTAMVFLQKQFRLKWISLNPLLLSICTLIGLLITRLFPSQNGAYGWIQLPGGFTLQPSEFAKVVIIVLIADYFHSLGNNEEKNILLSKRLLIFVLSFVGVVFLIQNDFGSSFVMLAIATVCFLTGSHKFTNKYQRILLLVMLSGMVLFVLLMSPLGISLLEHLAENDYRIRRLLIPNNPFKYEYDWGYQIVQALTAIATGGMFGVGFGGSLLKYGNFPETNTDFILAIIIEELGFLGGFMLIFMAYVTIFFRLIKYVIKIKDIRAKIILMGVFTYFLTHFVLNVGGVTSLIPLTGVPLLLISSGGSSAMSCLISLGLAQSMIIKYKKGEIQ